MIIHVALPEAEGDIAPTYHTEMNPVILHVGIFIGLEALEQRYHIDMDYLVYIFQIKIIHGTVEYCSLYPVSSYFISGQISSLCISNLRIRISRHFVYSDRIE